MAVQGDRERKWNTLAACRLFDHDPVVHACGQRLWDASPGGKDYSGLASDARYVRDAITVLNYLDSMAISLHQGIYVEEIVHAQFRDIVPKLVNALILGEQSGGIKGGKLAGRDEYVALLELCERWSKPNYKPVRD